MSPNGVLGDPTGATATEGRRLLVRLSADLDAAVTACRAPREVPPRRQCAASRRGACAGGGSPLKVFRVTPAGARLVDDIAVGKDITVRPFVERLIDAGAIHPLPDSSPFTPADVTAVIPTYRQDVLEVISGLGEVGRIIVVDDASPVPVRVPDGVEVVRHPTNLGPGVARGTGLATVTTPLVAFVDADTLSAARSALAAVAALLR